MRKNRLLLSTMALAAAVSTAAVIPVATAQAATNGLTIRTLTKNVVQGDTGRIKGKVIGAKAGVSVTIQQRSPQSGKDWGSGRTLKTDKNGKFLLDRVIKGKFSRDYRVCIGAPGKRRCSLRARIQVVPRTVGIFQQQVPTVVNAGEQMTVRGSTDSALAGRTVELQQLNPANLKYYPIGSAVVRPDFTFEVVGTPLITKLKVSTFKLASPAFAARSQVTVSSRFEAAVFGFVPLTDYTAVSGGYTTGTPTQQKPAGAPLATETFTNAVTTAAGTNTFTINTAGNCNRFTASVFVANTAADDDAMRTSVVSAVGANETIEDAAQNIRKGEALRQVDVGIADATTLRITQNPETVGAGTPGATGNAVPVWYANPTLACAF